MGRLIFTYGVMGSAKSATALIQKYELERNGKRVILLKPSIDDRDGTDIIKSRIGLEARCVVVGQDASVVKLCFEVLGSIPDVIIVDESQFLTANQVDELKNLTASSLADCYCYGLKTDFRTRFFDGSKRLMEVANELREVEKDCAFCKNKAEYNARFDKNGHLIVDGEQVVLGTTNYAGVCHACYDRLKRQLIDNCHKKTKKS